MKYCISGDPTPLARARFGHGVVFDSQKQLKLIWGIHLRSQHDNQPKYSGPLGIFLIFYMPMSANATKKRKLIPGDFHYIRPDNSNLVKFIEDVGNDVIYNDDAVIADIRGIKIYDKKPRTELIIQPLPKNIIAYQHDWTAPYFKEIIEYYKQNNTNEKKK